MLFVALALLAPVSAAAPAVDLQITPNGATITAQCVATDMTPEAYDFDFGDGTIVTDTAADTVQYTYASSGNYNIYCAATEGSTTVFDTEAIAVTVPLATLDVQSGFPMNNTYVFVCTNNFGADTFDWDFGDGEMLTDVSNDNVMHTYTTAGNYTAYCQATQGSMSASATLAVEIMNSIVNPSVSVYVKPPFPQENNFTFVCETPGMNPSTYDWEITHVSSGVREYLQYDISSNEIWHSMRSTGDYFVSCSATEGDTTLSGALTVTNYFAPPISQQPGSFAVLTMNASTTTLVVPAGANQDIYVMVPQGITDIRIDLSALLVNSPGETRAFMPISAVFDAMTATGEVEVTVPAGISIYSTTAWDGILTLPQSSMQTATLPSGAVAGAVIEIGANVPIEFDKGVRIRFAGRANESVVYVKNGVTTEISTTCSADTQAAADALAPAGDCKIVSGSDLVVWTKHFTEFATYSTPVSKKKVDRSHGGGFYERYQKQAAPEQSVEPTPAPQETPVIEASAEPTPEPVSDNTRLESRAALTGQVTGDDRQPVPQWLIMAGLGMIVAVGAVAFLTRFKI
jgi:PKD repeat protein